MQANASGRDRVMVNGEALGGSVAGHHRAVGIVVLETTVGDTVVFGSIRYK